MNNVIVIGSGFAGSTMARELADQGKRVTIIEQRHQTGGNSFDREDYDGVPIHLYGPHIFHTNSEKVYEFINRFGLFKKYEHRVLGCIDGKYVPIPFNYKSMEMLLEDEAADYKELLSAAFKGRNTVTVSELLESENDEIKELGDFIYQKVFVNYTAKQWGISAEDIDKSVLSRVPVILGYDDRYFQDKYQIMPKKSYADIFANMLDHKNIKIKLDTEACKLIEIKDNNLYYEGKPFDGDVIYTGAIDELFNYKYGVLPYRSVNMIFQNLQQRIFQPAAVVNYPNEFEFTRITEFKHFYDKKGSATTILKEYPIPYDKDGKGNIPYYVIPGEENTAKYKKYKALAEQVKNLYLVGRLAEYKYYNMDAAILAALDLFDKCFKNR